MVRRLEGLPVAGCLLPQQAAEIQGQLERLLASPQFRGSRRCQSLLRHVTEHALTGDTGNLKERTLGVEVFGRPADYDTNQDPIVRATAAEIRKKLAQYYQEAGHENEPRIELLCGSYVPELHGGPAPVTPIAVPAPRRLRWLWVALGGTLLAILIAGAGFAAFGKRTTSLDRFWQPALEAPGTVLISLGQPVAYNLVSAQAQDRMQSVGRATPGDLAPETISKRDLVILRDRYIALGDAACLARLAGLLEKHGKPYRIRGESATSSSDLRENAAILIGAFNNQWTLRAANKLRFTFVKDSARNTDMLRDRQHPERTDWKLTDAWPFWDIQNDYAIVSRLIDANTDRPVVIAAGITHFGTMGAGEFLTEPEYFAEVVPQLPRGWQTKNLQIVLRVPVAQGASGHPRVLATHVW